jgi:hypothetical protein
MNRRRAITLMLAATLVLPGCFGRSGRNRGNGTGPVLIQVHNNNWADVVVYAVSGSQTMRIGDVTTGKIGRFHAPPDVDPTVRDFRIRIDPIGPRGTFLTQLISVAPGQTIFVTVENDLNMTSFTVR